nr:hypothetical protein GCM10020092_073470 [Actinoplanes digitatis]
MPDRPRSRRALAGVVVCLLAVTAMPGRAAAALPTWPANPNWQALVPAPATDGVRAASITRTSGNVTNAGGLAGQGTGATVLTTSATNSPATVILDFGKEVGGTPFITVSAASGAATVRVATSEALPFLTAGSGGVYNSDNGSAVTFSVNGARTYTGALRGGFRFAALQLTTASNVTLTAAGVNFKAYRATPDRYQGWFISSDDQLNRMWYAGAYTAQMDMVPTGVASCFTVPVIFDGAKRDRAIWSGDLMITNPVAQLSLGTNSAPYVKGSITSITNLQASNGWLTSAVGFRGCGAFDYAVTYSAYSAIIAVQYYRYTNDTAFITGLRSKLEAATAYHATRVNANGLVVTNDNDYWQTSQSGEVTEYSLAYYELLQNMIWMEGRVGTAARVTEYTNKANALKTAINARLFNASAGLYQHTNSRPNVFPLDANMNAVRLGVAPADRVSGILSYFRARWQAHGSQISQPAPSMADPYGHTIEPLNNTWEVMARFARQRHRGRARPPAPPLGHPGRPEQRLLHRHLLGVRQRQRPAVARLRQPGTRLGSRPDTAAHRERPRRHRGQPRLRGLAGQTAGGHADVGAGPGTDGRRIPDRQMGPRHHGSVPHPGHRTHRNQRTGLGTPGLGIGDQHGRDLRRDAATPRRPVRRLRRRRRNLRVHFGTVTG